MYAVTDKFKAALIKSHTATARADLYVGGSLAVYDMPVLAGSITEDATATIRSRCGLELAATDAVIALLPKTPPAGHSLWPLGNEVRVFAGIDYEDGTVPEMIPQGVFRINKPVVQDSGADVTISIEGYDRGRSVSRARFTRPYLIAAGTNYSTAIKTMIMSRLQSLTDADFQFMTTSYTTPSLVFTSSDDPWEMAQSMAQSLGAELFWNNVGVCELRPQPDPLFTPPVWAYIDGKDATILSLERGLDDEMAYNGCVVTSEHSSLVVPLRAEAWDTNAASPTYYDPAFPALSKYGPVPFFIATQYITTQAQADEAALANLRKKLGIIEALGLGAINNPAHQANDVVSVKRDRVNVDNVYILNSITKGLGNSTDSQAVCRSRRTA